MKYKKKPVIIEAFQYDGDLKGADNKYYVPSWAEAAFESGIMHYASKKFDSPECELFIDTLEGTHHVSVGDYIIQGVNGELYPCKPDIFEKHMKRWRKKLWNRRHLHLVMLLNTSNLERKLHVKAGTVKAVYSACLSYFI